MDLELSAEQRQNFKVGVDRIGGCGDFGKSKSYCRNFSLRRKKRDMNGIEGHFSFQLTGEGGANFFLNLRPVDEQGQRDDCNYQQKQQSGEHPADP